MFYPPRENSEKPYGGHPPPPPLYVVHRIRYFINEKEKRSERLEQVNFR